jgi:hypothetical protein
MDRCVDFGVMALIDGRMKIMGGGKRNVLVVLWLFFFF